MPTPLLPRPDGLIFPSLGPCPTIPPPFGHEWVCAFAAQRTDLSAPIYALEYRCLNLDASDSALSDTARSDSLRVNRAVFFLTGCLGGLLLAGGAWLYVNLTAHTQPAPPAGPMSSANAPLATSADMARCYASAIADEPAPPHVFPWEPLPAGTGASTARPVAGGRSTPAKTQTRDYRHRAVSSAHGKHPDSVRRQHARRTAGHKGEGLAHAWTDSISDRPGVPARAAVTAEDDPTRWIQHMEQRRVTEIPNRFVK